MKLGPSPRWGEEFGAQLKLEGSGRERRTLRSQEKLPGCPEDPYEDGTLSHSLQSCREGPCSRPQSLGRGCPRQGGGRHAQEPWYNGLTQADPVRRAQA